jgi:hypothetical protein
MIKGEILTKFSLAVNFPIGIRAAGQARILTAISIEAVLGSNGCQVQAHCQVITTDVKSLRLNGMVNSGHQRATRGKLVRDHGCSN